MRNHSSLRIAMTLSALLLALGLMALGGNHAHAQGFSSSKQFGVGAMIGSPTGFSGKYYITPGTAIDAGLGFSYSIGGNSGLHIHVDYLLHPIVAGEIEYFVIPLYIGAGGRLLSYDPDNEGNVENDDSGLKLGGRVALGVMLDFKEVPVDAFFETALILDFITDDGLLDLNMSLGGRYYF